MQTHLWIDRLDGAALAGVTALCAFRALRLDRSRAGWSLLALASAALGAGAFVGSSTVIEASRLAGYGLGGTALAALGRCRFRRLSWALCLDCVVAALTLAALVTAVGPRGASYPLFDLLLLGVVVVVAVWQGLRPSRESVLLSAALTVLTVSDALGSPALRTPTRASELGLLAAGVLIGVAACVARADSGERAPERWVAIVAPTALSLVDVALLSDGRLLERLGGPTMQLARLAFFVAFVRVFVSFVAAQRQLATSLRDAASDPLTGLPNRRALAADWSVLAGERSVCAIYDLDGFKQYNDTFGHDAGDMLLSTLGERLADAVAGRGTAYRLGGDEFCVIAPEAHETDGLLADAAAALTVEGVNVSIRPSYGAALVPDEAVGLNDALRLADERMYGHKAGRIAAPRLLGVVGLTPG